MILLIWSIVCVTFGLYTIRNGLSIDKHLEPYQNWPTSPDAIKNVTYYYAGVDKSKLEVTFFKNVGKIICLLIVSTIFFIIGGSWRLPSKYISVLRGAPGS